jgi:hypothetical protein
MDEIFIIFYLWSLHLLRVLLAYPVIKNRALAYKMNIDYIRIKCKLLHGATPEERDRLFMNIGICAGLMSAQSDHLSAHKRDEIKNWLQENAIKLRLPKLPSC